jgi:hypothetical protein
MTDLNHLTIHDLQTLPVTVDLVVAAGALGIGSTKAYELARRSEFLCRIIRVGDLYRVVTADLIRLLGFAVEDSTRRQRPRRDGQIHVMT